MSFKSKILTYSFIKEQSSIKYQAFQNIQTKIRKVQKHIAKHQVSSSVAFVCGRWICHSLPTLCLNKIFEGCYKEIICSIIEECFILFDFLFSFILFFLISYLEIYSSSTRQKPLCTSC